MNTMTARLGEFVRATDIIREDHRRLKALFRDFDSADESVKPEIAQRALEELELHALIEEECFYPALKTALTDHDALIAAREAHHLAKVLITELKVMPSGRRFNAKFLLLSDNVLQHIKDEEDVLLPAAERSGIDLSELGQEMALIKYRQLGGSVVGRASGSGVPRMVLIAGVAALAYAYWNRASAD